MIGMQMSSQICHNFYEKKAFINKSKSNGM